MNETLESRLRKAFPHLTDENFGHWATDLHVKHNVEIVKWLKENYEFYKNVRTFVSSIDGSFWLDIPFAANSRK